MKMSDNELANSKITVTVQTLSGEVVWGPSGVVHLAHLKQEVATALDQPIGRVKFFNQTAELKMHGSPSEEQIQDHAVLNVVILRWSAVELANFLNQVDPMHQLRLDECKKISNEVFPIDMEKDQYFFKQGEKGSILYILIQGSVLVQKQGMDKHTVVSVRRIP
eukprot:gnl/MRDRNA2_/MRDRNA2_276347_c0_seq1.p1 gnl/MRDRNA2_/MRDRNA2_276347_c0~~gnl/MRDRNA2_/MRDRNA2_276347_c0_seq1.p1  ORF type:complete len:164 (-),score=32.85 gnl/MRDRNA2_/MRDRNA2_276347_c0_seq1:1-492(-)